MRNTSCITTRLVQEVFVIGVEIRRESGFGKALDWPETSVFPDNEVSSIIPPPPPHVNNQFRHQYFAFLVLRRIKASGFLLGSHHRELGRFFIIKPRFQAMTGTVCRTLFE
jgi:hypothetical protein